MDEFFYLPISELRKIARIKFGKDPWRIGEIVGISSYGAFYEEPPDEFWGPPTAGCCFALEDGTGHINQEDGSGCIQPETCAALATMCLELEDGSGHINQEDGSGCISQEA